MSGMSTKRFFMELLRHAHGALARKFQKATGIPTSTYPRVEFPNEIVLQFLEYMPTYSLISCRSVCRTWRHLVSLANLLPARRRLFDFYTSLATACPTHSRHPRSGRRLRSGRKLQKTQEKDILERDVYIETHTRCFLTLPKVFVLWMKEWPGHFELRHIQVLRSDQLRWFHLELFLGKTFVGLARTKPICGVEDGPQHEGHMYPCPLVYLERKGSSDNQAYSHWKCYRES
ncbi:hypothetical protein M413DRAFT_30639 [Hebeloma cylindrosporum]|uniref:F-box domain-containing protein n=1 Tax=Hebeloma cylindrosporum TaxID=76867 RepID=A0A0C3C098_HEBCY|nr:hypothetical protein M413DRAFT_30639 [Hebeloma cylindrosporum h7]